MISFSLLTASDATQIEKLYADSFLDGWNLNMLNSAFATGRFFAVGAFKDGSLIGVVTASMGYDDADIESLFVLEKFRRQGVADGLFNAMEDKLKSLGAKRLLLEVREGNIGARAFYLKKGFLDISIRKKYYGDGENAVVMEKGSLG